MQFFNLDSIDMNIVQKRCGESIVMKLVGNRVDYEQKMQINIGSHDLNEQHKYKIIAYSVGWHPGHMICDNIWKQMIMVLYEHYKLVTLR